MHLIVPLCAAIILLAFLARRRRTRPASGPPKAVDHRVGIIHRAGNEVAFGCGDPGDPHVDKRTAVVRRQGKPDYVRVVQASEASKRTCHDCFLATGREEPEKSSSG